MLKLLSTRSRLLLTLQTAGLVSILIIGYLAWSSSRAAILESRQDQLASIRLAKAQHVEAHFSNMDDQLRSLATDESIIRAMVQLNRSYRQLSRQLISDEWNGLLTTYYETNFLPRLKAKTNEESTVEPYLPQTTAAQYLQHHYVVTNGDSSSDRALLIDAGDESEYTQFHKNYHPFFHGIIQRHPYTDLLLVELETQQVIYSVAKNVDFGSSPLTGPSAEDGLARALERVLATPEEGVAQVVDYSPYAPSSQILVGFMAMPIFNGPHIVGILVLQFSTESIDAIATGFNSWESGGYGQTGESYIVGDRGHMRSTSRLLVEDQAGYVSALRQAGQPEQNIALVEEFGTSILFQQVGSVSAREAVAGRSGATTEANYLGQKALTSYGPLNIPGLNWGIITQMGEAEVLGPIDELLRQMLITGVILVGFITFLSILAAGALTHPIEKLLAYSRQAEARTVDIPAALLHDDEFGELAKTVCELSQISLAQRSQIERQQQENESLLQNLVPQAVAQRIRAGETQVVVQHHQATLLHAQIVGISELSDQVSTVAASELLTRLLDAFDEATERLGLEIHRSGDTDYKAVSGLNIPQLDHTKRAVDLAIEMLGICSQADPQFNQNPTSTSHFHDADLSSPNNDQGEESKAVLGLKVSIHTGQVTAGIIDGSRHFGYHLWGDAVNKASYLAINASVNEIVLTTAAHERVAELYHFIPDPTSAGELWLLEQTMLGISVSELPRGEEPKSEQIHGETTSV